MTDPSPSPVAADEVEELPAASGAYLLVIDLLSPITLQLPNRPPVTLDEGRYLYAGSARGPGGIRARARHHIKGAKPIHWHVDRLTNLAGAAAILAFPGGDECALTAAALALPGATIPAPGFGASDCPTCSAHLIAVPDHTEIEDLPALLSHGPAVLWRRPPVACFWRPKT